MFTKEQAPQVMDKQLKSSDGEKLGTVGQIFLDDKTSVPEWATVSTGTFSKKESFVPLAEAELSGDDLTVPYDKDTVKNAPQVEVESGHLSQQDEAELYKYYGLAYSESSSDSGLPVVKDGKQGNGKPAKGAVGRDTSGPTTDDAMTRSEEQLKVGTETREAGKARLRKYVVTENVTQTVPVSHEEVRVEREPITEANRDNAMAGGEITDEEHEVTLHEERAVVSKETVPVERVRMETETVTSEEQITEQVRKEQIDTDTNGPSDKGTAQR